MPSIKTKQTTPPAFRMPSAISLGDLLDKEFPPQRSLLSPWLNVHESCLMWAESGAGKSMLSQTIALVAAGGGAVLGWNCPEPVRVLYIDGEMSGKDVKSRFKLLQSTITGGDLKAVRKNLQVMNMTMQAESGGFVDIANRGHHAAVLEYVQKGGFELVVFDNFSVLSDSVEDENSAAAMKPMQTLLAHLKKHAAVLLVHHTGKNKVGPRGSSAIETTFERIIGITKNESASRSGIDVLLKFTKYRDRIPEGFRMEFPLTFTSKEQPDGTLAACWEMGGDTQSDEGWSMFVSGKHHTKKAFLAEYDKRFETSLAPGKFYRLKKQWLAAGRRLEDIERAEERMAAFAELDAEEAAGEFPPAF